MRSANKKLLPSVEQQQQHTEQADAARDRAAQLVVAADAAEGNLGGGDA